MVLYVLRALFVLFMAAVGWSYYSTRLSASAGTGVWLWIPCAAFLGALFVGIDIFSPRKKLAILSGAFLGLLVGVAIAFALSFVVQLLVATYYMPEPSPARDALCRFIDLLVGAITCYLSISFILQTKDDVRFILPYVEFSKQVKGARPILLDSSVLIDGRIVDIAGTGILESRLIVPTFVLEELQTVADSADRLKRNRGRRGLDIVAALRKLPKVEISVFESPPLPRSEESNGGLGVDKRLTQLAKDLNARILSNDSNLNKVAALNGVDVININELGNALKPVVLPGERLTVEIVRPGEEAGQGVGYLSDGTMVVVEQARELLGRPVEVTVSRALQTSAGRMIFGRLIDGEAEGAGRRPAYKN
ncbi:MAG TPA: TRAM domain-containing protein [Tepidisphaeraceae bacterium]|jgi:uncharacterized protein YacL|nr:TRAM domain-containing protein [Tepidisphaeraceae bacterium]